MSTKVVIVAGDSGRAVAALADAAKNIGETVAVVVGDKVAEVASQADLAKVICISIPDQAAPEAATADVIAVVKELSPALVLSSSDPTDRVLIGGVAGALGAPIVADVKSVSADGDAIQIDRIVHGGISEQVEKSDGLVCATFEPTSKPDPVAAPAPIEQRAAAASGAMNVISEEPPSQAQVDLAAASKVVCVGRGFKTEADLSLANDLAKVLTAEVGCTRPIAEGLNWLPKNTYLGVSGKHIAPKLYVGVGLSGQLQHMVGVRASDIIVAINNDAKAPIFNECDYGIVGDLYQVVPALTEALKD